jgi:hypothetical protein
MSYSATVYKVMIASPDDVPSERAIIREILAEWNTVNADSRATVLLPVGWETHASPTMGDRPQAIINKQILKDCDLLVGVFWTRLGTPTGEYMSGTVEEIEEHIKAGKPVMLYFSSVPVLPDSVDADQYAQLRTFKESCKSRGIFETYVNLNDFKDKFYRQLQLKLIKDDYFTSQESETLDHGGGDINSRIPDIPQLSTEAQVLLREAGQDSNGNIMRAPHLGGFLVQTNGKSMVDDNDPRNRAIWEAAIEELENERLIADRGYKREVFGVTREGYEVAALLNP